MAQCYELARIRVCFHRHGVLFKRVLDLHDVFAKEEETPRWEISLGSFRVADGSGGGDRGEREVVQTECRHRLGSRHIAREFRVASGSPLVQAVYVVTRRDGKVLSDNDGQEVVARLVASAQRTYVGESLRDIASHLTSPGQPRAKILGI